MTVQTIMDDAQGYVDTVLDGLRLTVENARTLTSTDSNSLRQQLSLVLTNNKFTPAKAPKIEFGEMPKEPQLSTPAYPPAPGEGPTYQDITDFDARAVAGDAPKLTAEVPDINLPDRPNELREFNEPRPSFAMPQFPAPPDELLHPNFTVPTVTARAALVSPQLLVPTTPHAFGGVVPDVPTGLATTYQSAYRDAAPSTIAMVNGYVDAMLTRYNPRYAEQMGRIEDQLATYLNGGTGIKPEVEDAIYARALEKNDAEAQRVRDAAYTEAANRGFTLPNGALTSAVARARQQAANNNAAAAREIVVMQAELEQKNLQFAVTTSIGLRTAVLNATLAYMQNLATLNGQALEYAKGALNSLIEVYNTSVKSYSVTVDAYKAEVMSFDAQLKSVLAEVDLFQSRIKNEEALIGLDRNKIELYKTQLDGVNTLAAVFKSQVDTALGQAQLEKLKLDVFQNSVQVYSAQVQGKNAEWQGYNAAIEGESAKAKLYAAEVEAFNAEIAGYRARLESGVETVKSQALVNKARAEQYGAEANAYEVATRVEGVRLNTELENQRQYWSAANGKNQVAESVNRINIEGYKEDTNARLIAFKQGLEIEMKKVDVALSAMGMQSDMVKSQIDVHAKTASAALAGINTLASESRAE